MFACPPEPLILAPLLTYSVVSCVHFRTSPRLSIPLHLSSLTKQRDCDDDDYERVYCYYSYPCLLFSTYRHTLLPPFMARLNDKSFYCSPLLTTYSQSCVCIFTPKPSSLLMTVSTFFQSLVIFPPLIGP